MKPHAPRISAALLLLVPLSLSAIHPEMPSQGIAALASRVDNDEVYLAIETFVNSSGTVPLAYFVDTWLDEACIAEIGREKLTEQLNAIRKACANPGGVMIQPGDAQREVVIVFETSTGRWNLELEFSAGTTQRICRLLLEKGVMPEPIAPFTWDSAAQRMSEYEKEGFAGSVLLVRKGKIVLNEGYGFANEALGARNRKDTMFAIGSSPIDYTHVSILLLEECGLLRTNDLLSKYVDNVPEDKATMTLAHLMTGRSGLRNFHGIRGVDENLDLTYIDRDEALRRILGAPLLFAPGRGNEHSHSAWGVLAAVVEIVTGGTFDEFIQENLFEPAGMKSTGMYPHSLAFDDKLVAVGQEAPTLGKPNSPKNWGPTSWLVMGSGGMVSSTQDFYLWMQALRAGKILSPEQQKKFWKGIVLSGGNDRGFMTLYTEGPESLVILCSNSSVGLDDISWDIGYGLADLVQGKRSTR